VPKSISKYRSKRIYMGLQNIFLSKEFPSDIELMNCLIVYVRDRKLIKKSHDHLRSNGI
jgi:hypothetical protein